MITTIVYTLVFVLAFPTLATAECAWVLWSEVSLLPKSSKTIETRWLVGGAVQSQDACQSLMRQDIDVHVAKLREMRDAKMEGDTVIASGRDFSTVRRYFCLPDTVDPRGPTSGAR
jgi:hypothetical protein